uniref:hypothetical protein n=1 Tax=Magnusiomyces fungicola TaxID=1734004 RepID=UPI001BEF0C1B|nr:hypothetical protein MFQ77_mgp03 [Saprochaete fungicola]QUV75105.1 hypothetical protein [Saprochaete fungicola]
MPSSSVHKDWTIPFKSQNIDSNPRNEQEMHTSSVTATPIMVGFRPMRRSDVAVEFANRVMMTVTTQVTATTTWVWAWASMNTHDTTKSESLITHSYANSYPMP